jgi:hypothetical protein
MNSNQDWGIKHWRLENKESLGYPNLRSLTLAIYRTCQGKTPNSGGASSFECQAARFQCRASGAHIVYHKDTPALHSHITISFSGHLIDKCTPYVFTPVSGIETHLWLGVTHTSEPLGHHRHINHTSQCSRKQIGLVISSFALACRVQRDWDDQVNRNRIGTPIAGHQPRQGHS